MDLIVARFMEDLQWLNNVPDTIQPQVFNKGQDDVAGAVRLPNRGREAHTYLHYIVENYSRLPEFMVFCQGRPFDHVPSFHKILRAFAAGERQVQPFEWLGFVIDWDDGEGSRLFQQWSKNPEQRPLQLADFHRQLFGEEPPDRWVFYLGGHFAVTREAVHRRSLAFYERARALSVECADAAHCFERCWDRVFDVKGVPERYCEADLPVYLRPVRRLGTTWEDAAEQKGADPHSP